MYLEILRLYFTMGVQDQAQCGQHDQLDYASISRQGIWENPQHRL